MASPELMSVPVADTIALRIVDGDPWRAVEARLLGSLEARHLGQLASPATLIVHGLLDSTTREMHMHMFARILEAEAGLFLEGDEAQLEQLYQSELSEHGYSNVINACQAANWQVTVSFPPMTDGDDLITLEVPFPWSKSRCRTNSLIEALGFQLKVEEAGTGSRIALSHQAELRETSAAPELLDASTQMDDVWNLFIQLGYGLMHLSAAGEMIAISPSMLTMLHLDGQSLSAASVTEAIPVTFHNDIIWGQVLTKDNGTFENYRIRVPLHGQVDQSILFNVSGFRQSDGRIISLWQAVSQDEGGARLGEGSMLTEARVSNITRNYVPQLVEKKARDAVRLGMTNLGNEERHVAILFCDIVGFTSYVETHDEGESVIDTLNTILRRISVSVKRNGGAIDKFMGDCIMALFDLPEDAVLAAMDMQTHASDINELRIQSGRQALQLRIGIHWGKAVIGNIGTAERLDWTAIGDTVNTASRIEKNCQPGSVLISSDVKQVIEAARPGFFRFDDLFRLQVKGKRDELAVCHVSLAADA